MLNFWGRLAEHVDILFVFIEINIYYSTPKQDLTRRQIQYNGSMIFSSRILSLLFLIWLPVTTFAHEQLDTAYLLINGDTVEENPSGNLIPNATQTLASKPVTTGQTVTVQIDTTLVSPTSEYGYAWDKDAAISVTGKTASHKYDQAGSHVLSVFLRPDSSSKFIPLNTVKIDVLPQEKYILPSANVIAEISGRKVTFTANPKTDPSSQILSYEWQLGEGTKKTGQVVKHDYAEAAAPLYGHLRIKDSQQFYRDYAFQITPEGKTVKIIPFEHEEGSIIMQQAQRKYTLPVFVGLGLFAIAIFLTKRFVVLKQRKNKS